MDHTFTIHFLRHAPTEGNVRKQYIGWTDEPIVQGESILPLDLEIMNVIGSDLVRCQQTAERYFPNAQFQGFQSFREMHFGDFERKTYEELKELSIYRDWIDQPFTMVPPNGESFPSFETRVLDAFRSLDVPNGQYFVLHGGVIRLLLMHLAPKEKEFWAWQVPHHERFSLTWENADLFKEGQRCTSLSVEPIMGSENS